MMPRGFLTKFFLIRPQQALLLKWTPSSYTLTANCHLVIGLSQFSSFFFFFLPRHIHLVIIPLSRARLLLKMLDRFATLDNVDVRHLNILLWFYSLMDPSRNKMYSLYVSELRILKATWRKSRHEYVVAIVKDTEDIGPDSRTLYLMLERSRAPQNKTNGRTGQHRIPLYKKNSRLVDYEADTCVKQQRYWFQQYIRKRMASKHATDASRSRPKSPASLFTPLAYDSRGPTKDPVRVLTNPWVHEQDEVVAVLHLPSPSPPHDVTDDQTVYHKFNDSVESLLETLSPTHTPAMFDHKSEESSSDFRQQRPLYLFELIILACTLKQAKPEYQILTSNCFWYCAMIFHLVRLRHRLGIDTSTSSVSLELSKPRHVLLPAILRFVNALPAMNVNQKKLKSGCCLGWRRKDEDADAEEDSGREGSSLSSRLSSSSSSSTSWYAQKLGTWYGIRVARTPTKRVLHKWLSKMEEAIDWFHSDALLAHYGHNLGSTMCTMDVDEPDGFSEDDSSTLTQSSEDLFSLTDSEISGSWSPNTSLSSLGIGRFDTASVKVDEMENEFFL